MIKHTGRFTLEITAISRTVPSRIPIAPSSRGIIPFIMPRSTIRLCSASQTQALASRIFPSFFASLNKEKLWSVLILSCVKMSFPSGKYSDILQPPLILLRY